MNTWRKLLTSCLLVSFVSAGALIAQALAGSRVDNWSVPPYHRSSTEGGLTPMTDIGNGVAFVAMVPCRVFDTRDPNGAYGGPRLLANTTRNFDIDNGPCGPLPVNGVNAYSMNFGAILPDGQNGFIKIWPAGGAEPNSSAINPIQGTVVANAAIVPAGTGGAISVRPNTGVHLYGDINGYFPSTYNEFRYFEVRGSFAGGGMNFGENQSNIAGSSGVRGRANQTTGATYGVQGETYSTSDNAAGVAGWDVPGGQVPGTHVRAGVRGESTSGSTGVLGMVSNFSGEGVTGFQLNSSTGAELAGGYIGFTTSAGIVFFNGLSGSGTKSFLEPHPTDASKMIKFISLEGNEPGTYFRGRARFQNGIALIPVPEEFRMVTDAEGLSIQVTPIGDMATVAVQSIGLDRIVVRGSRNVEFFYTVNGVRRAYKGANIIVENDKFFIPKTPDAVLPLWLSPDERQRLVTNGTYRPDGRVNMETAHRLGWDRIWAERERPRPSPEPAP